ncbi:MAG: TonB family protein [Terracidiphilus sp.]
MVTVMKTEAIRGGWTGRVIDDRFTLQQWLGGSDESGVFLTEMPGDQPQKAAIRLVSVDAQNADAQLARWQAAASLSHPHLMRLLHYGKCRVAGNPIVYAVIEFADENLAEILPHRPLTPGETSEMLEPVLDALTYLHGKGFVHGHLKPSNIMVVNDQVKLSCDNVQAAGKLDKRAAANGVYDAPEIAAGTITQAADVWSLGVTLVETLTQRPPVFNHATQADPVVPESIPQPFAGLARESLRFDPALRCTLGQLGDRPKAPQAQHQPPASKANPTAPANLRLPWVAAAVVVAIVLIVIFLMHSHHAETSQAAVEDQSEPAIAKPSAASPAPERQSSKPATPDADAPVPAPAHASNAAVVEQVLPDLLPKAVSSIHGQFVVKVRVSVDPTGAVSDADFDSEGPSKYFAKAALEAAKRWRFKPAEVGGEAVASAWVLEFRFKRDGAEVTPVKVAP